MFPKTDGHDRQTLDFAAVVAARLLSWRSGRVSSFGHGQPRRAGGDGRYGEPRNGCRRSAAVRRRDGRSGRAPARREPRGARRSQERLGQARRGGRGLLVVRLHAGHIRPQARTARREGVLYGAFLGRTAGNLLQEDRRAPQCVRQARDIRRAGNRD